MTQICVKTSRILTLNGMNGLNRSDESVYNCKHYILFT